tara:strand:- start:1207 stop:2400 length:1194 start_codon:yes stop_codon:yes gene_type:complete
MKIKELNKAAKRLLDLVDSGTTSMTSEDVAPYYVDIKTYTDNEIFELEKQKLFKERPLLMAFSSDVKESGDFITNEDTGIPIIITRNKKGTVKAYLNVCRHRGARLLDRPCGNQSRGFVCPYHAWRYDLDGDLISIYGEETFGEIDRSLHSLIELPAEEKYGLIYVQPTPGPAQSIDDILGKDLGAQMGSWNLDNIHLVNRGVFDMPTNWKLAMDTFVEGYHFGPLHPETIAQATHSNVMIYDRYNYNHRLGFPSLTIGELKDKPEKDWDAFNHFNWVYFLFPNITFFVNPAFVYFFELYPGKEVGDHLTRFSTYSRIAMKTEEEKRAAQEHFQFIYSVVEKEDYWVSANVMKGFQSGLHPFSVFGRNELSLINMHEAFRESVGLDPSGVRLKRSRK